MKQSIKSRLPQIDDLAPFEKLVKQPFEGQKFIAWIDDNVKDCLCDLYNKGANALVLIGPEGDFSPEEVALAKENGFVPCSLGDARLRTETAAIVACHTIQLINQMKWRILLNKGSNLCLLHCRQTLYHLSHQGSPSLREPLKK